MNQGDYAIQSTIGLLNYSKRLPIDTEVEEWLREHGRIEARKKQNGQRTLSRSTQTSPSITT
jgi:hypothetical protein